MKKALLGLVAVGALISAPAMAADMGLPLKAPPAQIAPAFSWTGFYIGAQGGGGWGSSSASETASFLCPTASPACETPLAATPPKAMFNTSTSGPFGGVTVGANYQFNSIVLGVEGDWSAANINGSSACATAFVAFPFGATSGSCGNALRDFATVTGRLGYAWERALLYVKGGAVWARYNETVRTVVGGGSGSAANFSSDRDGWTIGVGVEYAFTSNWSFKVEYQHMDFGTKSVTFPFVTAPPVANGIFNVVANDTERVDIVRAGVNYRFNFGGPIATRY